MIKYIVSDLDGTLFKGHGDTIFDLTSENTEAICKAKEAGIHIAVASGRTYLHGKRILELNGYFDDVLCTGLNGSIIYDHGKLTHKKYLNQDVCIRIINKLASYENLFLNVQIQDLEEGRAYYYYDRKPSFKYKKECETLKIGIYEEISMLDFIDKCEEIGKISITSLSKEDSFEIESILKDEFKDEIGYSRSSDVFLELHHKDSNKANFIKYIMDTYTVSKDEIATVGDSYNDRPMFECSGESFVLESGDSVAKEVAKHRVKDVAECIYKCIEMNKEG